MKALSPRWMVLDVLKWGHRRWEYSVCLIQGACSLYLKSAIWSDGHKDSAASLQWNRKKRDVDLLMSLLVDEPDRARGLVQLVDSGITQAKDGCRRAELRIGMQFVWCIAL